MTDVGSMPRPSRFGAYMRLMRFDRPIGILLLLWPTLWALWMAADGLPSFRNLVIFTLGVVVMRAGGCVMNDLADRDLDPHVERTRTRPLASGELRVAEAVVLLFGLLLGAFVLVLFTNTLTIQLAFIGAALALTYPFFKRVTHLPQVVLGLAFGWAVPMAYAAEIGSIPAEALWLLVINMLWSVIYDTLYAMVDRDDDLAIGIKSTAILFGRYDLAILWGLVSMMVLVLVLMGFDQGFGWPWFCAVAIVSGLFTRQQYTIRNRDREACFRAFLNNNWVGFVIFAGLALEFALR
ncbi:MAG: 4-hydroxybenzoate octaprenyltransferase [Gammaproteobacteria bacterium]